MRVIDNREYFTQNFPFMMKATRMLIVDHDITRYHSFDLLRYTLFTREDLFVTTKAPYRNLLNGRAELLEQIYFMQHNVDVFNIYDMFEKDSGVHTMAEYTARVREMLASDQAKITPTDIKTKFGVVFDRSDITGYLLQYEGETNKPDYYDKLTVYEAPNPLDTATIADVISKENINAIMICSCGLAKNLIEYMIQHDITHPITFIIGRYAYNFHMKDGKCEYPLFNREFGLSEVRFKHEFGFFDPYSGITTSYRLREKSKVEGTT